MFECMRSNGTMVDKNEKIAHLGEVAVEGLTKDTLVALSPSCGPVESLFQLLFQDVVLDIVVHPLGIDGILQIVTKLHGSVKCKN